MGIVSISYLEKFFDGFISDDGYAWIASNIFLGRAQYYSLH
jgi:hypothetical protein